MTTNQAKYHVVKDVAFWLRLKADKMKIIHMQIGDCPQIVFEVKICEKDEEDNLYILADAIPMIHRIKDYISLNKISYEPQGIIEYVFNLSDSLDYLSDEFIKYRIPATKNIAKQVCEILFNYDDRLEASYDDDLIIYYYLSVFVVIDHPVFNSILERLISGLSEEHFILSTEIPTIMSDSNSSSSSDEPNDLLTITQNVTEIAIVQFYTDILYFLSLIAEPSDAETLQKQVNELTVTLCHKLNVRPPKQKMQRGRAAKLIHHFFKTKKIFKEAIVESVIDPPSCERVLNFGECLIMNQLKQLWQWYRLEDFHECYLFAINRNTKAHLLPEIKEESLVVINLYQKLWEKAKNNRSIPYSGFYESDEFLKDYDMSKYPSLLYAARKQSRNDSDKNKNAWAKLMTSLPLDFRRLDIDMQLDVPLLDTDDQLTGSYLLIHF